MTIALAVGIYFLAEDYNRKEELRREQENAAWTAIHKDQLEFRDASLVAVPMSYTLPSSRTYEFKITVKNNATVTLGYLDFKFVLRDCMRDGSECETIGSQGTSITARIPPGEVRELRGTLHFANQPEIKKTFSWSYDIEAIRRR